MKTPLVITINRRFWQGVAAAIMAVVILDTIPSDKPPDCPDGQLTAGHHGNTAICVKEDK